MFINNNKLSWVKVFLWVCVDGYNCYEIPNELNRIKYPNHHIQFMNKYMIDPQNIVFYIVLIIPRKKKHLFL